jgi:membrane protease YdiL (CAAX protease family)
MSDHPGAALPPRLPAQPGGRLLAAAGLDVLLALLVLIAISLGSGAVWTVWRGFQLRAQGVTDAPAILAGLGEPGALAQMLMAISSMAGAALLLYFWRRPAGPGERARSWQAACRPSSWGRSLLAGGAVFIFSSAAGWLMQLLGSDPVPTNMSMIEEAAKRWPLFLVLFAVVLAPAYEELLFRRVLFGRFLAAGRPWLGIVANSLVFALMHEVPGLSPNPWPAMLQLLLVYAAMGAAFSWVYWRTGTLWASVAAHAINNAIALGVHGL